MSRTVNGGVSFWYSSIGLPRRRPPLPGSIDADVCIVGAGFTGLWTAYYLKEADPSLDIVVLEQNFAGYGASGRNGGWLFNGIAGIRGRYAASGGREAVISLQREMTLSVDEVIRVAHDEGIDPDIVKGGVLTVARNPAQLVRLREFVADEHAWGETSHVMLSAEEAAGRLRISGAMGASFSPHGARIQPAKLVTGLAAAVEAKGVPIYESTRVTEIVPGAAVTARGRVSARHVLRATEGFTASIKGLKRTWLPMNSSIIVTEPLSTQVWDEIGWAGREVLGDMAHAYIYAQRTADDRIAFGGRGVPYRLGSRTDTDGRTQPSTIASLQRILVGFFPAAAGATITNAWSGVLGVPRDWCATVGLDPSTGLGWAGGYVGHGVTTTNLAGRTLRDLVLGERSALTELPWVGRRVRRWEPEPLRWAAVHSLYAVYRLADRQESRNRSARTSWIGTVADAVSGRD